MDIMGMLDKMKVYIVFDGENKKVYNMHNENHRSILKAVLSVSILSNEYDILDIKTMLHNRLATVEELKEIVNKFCKSSYVLSATDSVEVSNLKLVTTDIYEEYSNYILNKHYNSEEVENIDAYLSLISYYRSCFTKNDRKRELASFFDVRSNDAIPPFLITISLMTIVSFFVTKEFPVFLSLLVMAIVVSSPGFYQMGNTYLSKAKESLDQGRKIFEHILTLEIMNDILFSELCLCEESDFKRLLHTESCSLLNELIEELKVGDTDESRFV